MEIKVKTAPAPVIEVPTFTRQDMLKIGAKTIQTLTERVAKAIGVNDSRMKNLSPAYAKKKSKQGAPAIRNLMLNGSMLGALAIVQTTDNSVTIGFTRQSEAIKAASNQRRDEWFGLSSSDQKVINAFIDRLQKK